MRCPSGLIDGRAIVRELPAALDGRVAGRRLHLVARRAHRRRSDASRCRPEWRKLAPGGDLISCFPCAECVCCGCLRRRRRSPWPPFSARRGRSSARLAWAFGGAAFGSITCHYAKFLHAGVVEGFITPPAVSSCEVSEVMRSCGGAVQGVSEERTQPMSGAVALNRQVSSSSTSSSGSSSSSSGSVCPSHSGDTHSAPLTLCVQVDLALALALTARVTGRWLHLLLRR